MLAMYPASFFLVTPVVEVGAGGCLLLFPVSAFELLLGVSQATPEATFVGRVAGAALLALGVASCLARNDSRSSEQVGLFAGLLFYNCAVSVLLVYAALGMSMTGIALWPAVALHIALAGWCVACLGTHPKGRP
jgi:hypothetical protein